MTTTDDLPTVERYQPITGAQRKSLRDAIGRRYAAGTGIRALVAQTGRSYGFIHQLLVEAGILRRPRGGRKPDTGQDQDRAPAMR